MGGTGGPLNSPRWHLSPSDVLLLAVPTVTVLIVQPCAVWCFFPWTVNKRCDYAEGPYSSLRWDRAGGRGDGGGGSHTWDHLSSSLGRRSLF